MAKGSEKAVSGRRDFLKLAGLSAATGTAAIAAGPVSVDAAAAPSGGTSGYQETEHVKTYYRLAAF